MCTLGNNKQSVSKFATEYFFFIAVPGGILISPASRNCVLSRVLRFALSQKGHLDQIQCTLAGSLYA